MPISTISKPYTAANPNTVGSSWKFFPQRSGASESNVFTVVDQPVIVWAAGLAGDDAIALQVTPDGASFADFYLHDVLVQLTITNVLIVLKVPGMYRFRKVTGASSAVVVGMPSTMTHDPDIRLTLPAAGATGATGPTGPAGPFGGIALVGELRDADLSVTTDQTIEMLASRYRIQSIILENRSNNTYAAQGGFYTGANKTGDVLVPAAQLYPAVAAEVPTFCTLDTEGTYVREESEIYFSLSVAAGGALTADIFVYAYVFDV